MKYGDYMRRTTLTEEIKRIIQINEYGYDYDDVLRQSTHKPIEISNMYEKGANKNAVTNWLSRHEKEDQRKENHSRQKRILDINNYKNRMSIFNSLSKRNNINAATEETLKTIQPLRDKLQYASVSLSINNELELEFGYYLLKFNKYGTSEYGFGFSFDGLHLSPTFNSILNKERNGFKKMATPSFEDFKNFILKNEDVFEKEITDFLNRKRGK